MRSNSFARGNLINHVTAHAFSLFRRAGRPWSRVLGDALVQPGPRQTPLPLDRAQRHAEVGGDLLVRQPSEEAQLDYLRLPWVGHRELVEGVIEEMMSSSRGLDSASSPSVTIVASRLAAWRVRA